MAEALTEEQENQIIIFIADDIMNNLNLNGIVEATKAFSLENAKRQHSQLSDEDKQRVIDHMDQLKKDSESKVENPSELLETPS
tara:strand:+ start:1130 stop:1381 length:252 start_codon:yes stop_codon:yes gene_type:complete